MWKIEFIVWAPTIFHLLLMFPQACVCLQNLCKLCSSVNNYVIFVCMRTQKRAEIHTYKKKTTFKKGEKGKMITHRRTWWQAAFWKWAPLVYLLNISSTWESGDGEHICVWHAEWRTQWTCVWIHVTSRCQSNRRASACRLTRFKVEKGPIWQLE